jgi:hypothetical protein
VTIKENKPEASLISNHFSDFQSLLEIDIAAKGNKHGRKSRLVLGGRKRGFSLFQV